MFTNQLDEIEQLLVCLNLLDQFGVLAEDLDNECHLPKIISFVPDEFFYNAVVDDQLVIIIVFSYPFKHLKKCLKDVENFFGNCLFIKGHIIVLFYELEDLFMILHCCKALVD